MPASPRANVVAKNEVGVYHCWNRCVQRAYLCGTDSATGQNYDYRREWIEQTEQMLASLFAVEVAFHAEMGNHIHLVVRTRPDVPNQWSDREVVRRWLCITKLKRNGSDTIVEPTEDEITQELRDPKRVAELRRRLGSLSWFMGALGECVSRRCNRDSGSSGAFWEHRFKCRCLIDEGAILLCGIYVDLNAIRSREAETPEQSCHTSAHNRIQGLRERLGRRLSEPSSQSPFPDRWLCELTLQDSFDYPGHLKVAGQWRASDQGILSITLEKYLQLLDWTGRQVRADKRGAIPDHLAPILNRLGIRDEYWVDAVARFEQWFGRAVGPVAASSQQPNPRAYQGKTHCALVFG